MTKTINIKNFMLTIRVVRKMDHGIIGILTVQTRSNPIMKMEKRMAIGYGGEKTDSRIKRATIKMKKNMAFGQFGTIPREPPTMNYTEKHLQMEKLMDRLQNGIMKGTLIDKVL